MNLMKMIIKKIFRSPKAQSMVEMAIMLPLLLLILFAIIDFGRVFGAYMLIHDLARDGVRAGVVGATQTEIENQIVANDSFLNIVPDRTSDSSTYLKDRKDVHIQPDESGGSRVVGNSLSVTINYDVDIVTPIISSLVTDPFPISAHYTMRVERSP